MRLLLVGNGSSVLPREDQYDLVVRINRYDEGLRCDLWVNSLVYTRPEQDTTKKILRLNYGRPRDAERFPTNWRKNTTFWDKELHTNMCQELGLDNPSSGMMALYYLVHNTEYDIEVAGFNHEGFDVHNWDKERDIFHQYLNEGKLKRIWR